jgi:hypothetical protein
MTSNEVFERSKILLSPFKKCLLCWLIEYKITSGKTPQSFNVNGSSRITRNIPTCTIYQHSFRINHTFAHGSETKMQVGVFLDSQTLVDEEIHSLDTSGIINPIDQCSNEGDLNHEFDDVHFMGGIYWHIE